MPYEWIRNWWYRRPISRMFSVAKKLEKLEMYGQLVPRIFEFEITQEDAQFFLKYTQLRAYTPSPPAKSMQKE